MDSHAVSNRWVDADHSADYLARADSLPHRREGEAVLAGDLAGALPGRILDLGCGDGRLTALLLDTCPTATAVCVDMSPTMLDAVRARFDGDDRVLVVADDLAEPLPSGAEFDEPFAAVVSSLAIHHVTDERKRDLYAEMAARLVAGGVLANLDIVRSPTQSLHDRWRDEMGARDDPSDVLCDMSSQLGWIRDAGLHDVDCIWKWRSLALMRGERLRGERSRGEPPRRLSGGWTSSAGRACSSTCAFPTARRPAGSPTPPRRCGRTRARRWCWSGRRPNVRICRSSSRRPGSRCEPRRPCRRSASPR